MTSKPHTHAANLYTGPNDYVQSNQDRPRKIANFDQTAKLEDSHAGAHRHVPFPPGLTIALCRKKLRSITNKTDLGSIKESMMQSVASVGTVPDTHSELSSTVAGTHGKLPSTVALLFPFQPSLLREASTIQQVGSAHAYS